MTDQQLEYFSAFLEKEVELIDARDFEALDSRSSEKEILCQAFEKHMLSILNSWDNMSVERRHYLSQTVKKIRNHLMQNKKALLSAIDLHHQLIKVCLKTHHDKQIKLERYTAQAHREVEMLPPIHTVTQNL